MGYFTNGQPGRTVQDFLSHKAQDAYQESIKLGKSALSSDESQIANEIIERYISKGLELGKPTAKIDENKPNVASVSWPVIGNTNLLGMRDSQHNILESGTQNPITMDMEYGGIISNSPQLQQEIKQRITSITESFNRHFSLVDETVTAHNRHLRENVPSWVAERLKTVRGAKSAEDFLNS